ncbi:unnamed protein product, partial [Rotaria sp. Silwood2]
MGDFNIDIERDGDKADRLVEWMDSCSLGPVVPDTNTSLRSDRIIDYAITTGVDLTIQTYEGDTSSDHKPLLGVLISEGGKMGERSRTIWSVFSLFLSYTYAFWEKEWNSELYDATYERFISFLSSLNTRCQHFFTSKHARPSIPQEIIKILAQSRSLSFKAKRKGDIILRTEARRLRNLARFELKRFQQEQLAKSSPVATVFVDFKSAFDQLWFDGCLGKLTRMGIPQAYVSWIHAWLSERKATIEIHGKRSRWIQINRGGPQGSSLTPSLFITYHSDMADYIPGAMSFFFADDLAAVLAGQIGVRFTDQCVELERRLQTFLDQLELYSILAVQPINYSKTQVMFSARAIGYPNPLPPVHCGDHMVEWISSFKYLGYWLTTKLGWGNMIGKTRIAVRQRTAL